MLWLALASPAVGQVPKLLDLAALPPIAAKGRQAYAQTFLVTNVPRAFAIGVNGAWGMATGSKTLETAQVSALAACVKAGGTACEIYAQDLDVVWHNATPAPRAVPPSLLSGPGYEFVPDSRFLWFGPKAARGVFVWAHGRGQTDERGEQPHPYVRWFNDAGYDVVRFDRELAADDKTRAAAWLHDGLRRLRADGYRTVIAAGQSRGSWNALQLLDTPSLADVVIAVSPAAQGTNPDIVSRRQVPELQGILHGANPGRTRVAFVQFKDDPFSDDPDRRMNTFRDELVPKVAAFLAIDRPPDLTGHDAAWSPKFSVTYGACLLHFALDAKPPSAC